MCNLRKYIYLLLTTLMLVVHSVHALEHHPVPEHWLQEEIQDVIQSERNVQVEALPRCVWQDYLNRKQKMLTRVLIRYNQQKINWKNRAFWINPATKEQLVQDVEHELEAWNELCEKGESALIEATAGTSFDWRTTPTQQVTDDLLADLIQQNILSDQCPKEVDHSYLYDIIAQESVPYFKPKLPCSTAGVKQLLNVIWEQYGAYPYGPVLYYDTGTKQEITQTPVCFIASPSFEKLALKHYRFDKVLKERYELSFEKLDHYKAELIKLHLEYPASIAKDLIAESTNLILDTVLGKLLPDSIAGIIVEYVGGQLDVNAIDTYGHTALDYVQEDKLPLTYQILQQHGATHHKPIELPNQSYLNDVCDTLTAISPSDFVPNSTSGWLGVAAYATYFFFACASNQ